ncbi:MAG: hypothetical protein KAR13_12680, partial [Desulfobulbaceae bacterium]|nr:hypothetical protein [Desulfobulbaceae bacterium]
MTRKLFLVVLSSMLLFATGIGTAMAATVGISTLDGSAEIWVEPCTHFDVELYLELTSHDITTIQNIDSDNGIKGFTVDFNWDDSLVEYVGLTGGSRYTLVSEMDPSQGDEGIKGYNFGSPIAESHVLATLEFHCLGPGDTVVDPVGHFVDNINFGMAEGGFLENVVELDYLDGTVNQVPIPSTLLLLGTG